MILFYNAQGKPVWDAFAEIAFRPGSQLDVNTTKYSRNRQFAIAMQSDGNLVVYRTANYQPLWSTLTPGSDAVKAVMQRDVSCVCITVKAY